MKRAILISAYFIGLCLLLALIVKAETAPRIVVEWDAVVDPRLAGYIVKRGLGTSQPNTAISLPATDTQFVDYNVDPATTYGYIVVAKDAENQEGYPSEPVVLASFGWLQPATPSGLNCTKQRVGNKTEVTCSWQAVTTSVMDGKPLTVTYKVYRTGPGANGVTTVFAVPNNTFVDSVPKNKSFYYKVSATTSTSIEGFSSPTVSLQS